MEFFRDPKINFVGAMKPVFTISILLVIVTILSLVLHRGPRLSIDFTGGTIVQVRIAPVPDIAQLRAAVDNAGFVGAQVQEFGAEDEFLINFPQMQTELLEAAQVMMQRLRENLPDYQIELRREESVGPKAGGELRTAAANAVALALLLIVVYIWFRFVFRYGIAAIIALIHDVTLTLGIFSLLDLEISLSVIAAFLTIIGYSLNDTIVIFDRIRENMKLRRKESYSDVINRSINECLSRTFITSLTTFFVAFVLYLVGGPVIHDFAFALSLGVIIGTYSSMFIASPVLVFWYEHFIAERKRAGASM
ncbi:MAG: protein translocase subunit SecF [Candidatus Krumholzibacteria bacterium]|jgi:preprotein translocase subunit SecF|nr:protein translocase subunit SecF [Candidatus Krumholzibacteria bacterium]